LSWPPIIAAFLGSAAYRRAPSGCASCRRAIIADALIDEIAEALVDVWERLGLPLKKPALAAE